MTLMVAGGRLIGEIYAASSVNICFIFQQFSKRHEPPKKVHNPSDHKSSPSRRSRSSHAAMSEPILFEDAFSVLSVNSQKYERVSRITATSNDQQISLTLDVNTELYPMNVSDRVQIALALTLNLDGSKDDSKGWRDVGLGERSLADEYDYVCHGKIYRFEEGNGDDM